MRIAFLASLGAALLFASPSLRAQSVAQSVDVTYLNGLVTIQCKDAPLSNVFERIEQATGIELTLEDEVKSKRLSANLAGLPVSMAVSRLLEGVGVNYIVMMDPYDWERVDKIFVGAGGGGPARSAGPVRAPVVPEEPEEAFEDIPPEAFEEGMEFGDAADPGLDMPPEDMENPDEFGAVEDPEAFGPPGSSPLPEFLPPAQNYPRSNFTPGLPQRNQRTQGAQGGQNGLNQPQQFQQQDPANTPPATYPFTDPFGRPIPIPPGVNQQQQQQQQRRQQQQQQQQQQ